MRQVAVDQQVRRMGDAYERIAEQRALVEKLEPTSDAHRLAMNVLLALQDSLYVLAEAHAVIEALGQRQTGVKFQRSSQS